MVDALLHFRAKTSTLPGSGWSRAQIARVEDDTLYLEYLMEPREADRKIDRWSVEIAPHMSKTAESWTWKSTIKVDDNLDALDDCNKWLKATVVAIDEVNDKGRIFPMATIGMRVYSQTGARQDARGNYDGWGDRFDEKIPIFSPKLSQFLTMTVRTGPVDQDDDD